MAASQTSSLDYFDRVNFSLVHNDPMQDVNAALAACAQTLQHWHEGVQGPRPMSIYPFAIVYDSVAQRDQKWNLYLTNNPAIAAQHTLAEWGEEKQAYGILGNAINGANQRYYVLYVVSMQNPVFSHSWHMRHWNGQDTPALRAQFYTGDIEWHEFVLVLNQRQVRSGRSLYYCPSPPLLFSPVSNSCSPNPFPSPLYALFPRTNRGPFLLNRFSSTTLRTLLPPLRRRPAGATSKPSP